MHGGRPRYGPTPRTWAVDGPVHGSCPRRACRRRCGAWTAPYTGAARSVGRREQACKVDGPVHGGRSSGARIARRWASGRPRGGRKRSAREAASGAEPAGTDAPRGRCPRARAARATGPAWRLGCLVEERDHHPRGRQESSSTIRPVPAGNACRLPVPGPQSDHQPRPGRKHIPEDARGAYLPPWSAAPPRPRLLLPDLTERITVFSIDNSATHRCDGAYGSHVGGPLDCGQGWARRPLYDAPTRIKDLRAVQRAHQRPDRSNR